jgi:1-phosphofructokinase family hexose kinase
MKYLCVSANPAIDKQLLLGELKPGEVHRVKDARPHTGGKAAHVAMVLRTLGETPLWIGFAGGEAGEDLLAGLQDLGIRTHACATKQRTRVNLEIIEDGGRVTEILEAGGTPSPLEVAEFRKSCEAAFAQEREQLTVIFSGSLPSGIEENFYATLIGRANSYGCRTLLDTSGEALRLGLGASPGFVKPNRQEAERLLGWSVNGLAQAACAARQFITWGARSAAVSLGDKGLLWCPGNGEPVYHAKAVPVKAHSTVGSGDATVAAFAFAAGQGLGMDDTLRLAVACGAANCLADSPGAALMRDIDDFRKQVLVEMFLEAA